MRSQNFVQRHKIDDLRFTFRPYNLQSKIKILKSNSAFLFFGLALLFSFNFLLLSCSNEDTILAKKEKEAETIKNKADNMWRLKKEVDALKLYKQLAIKFPKTSVRKSAEDQLLKTGISIGSPLVSWTSKRMFKMENTIVAYRDAKGAYPTGHVIKHPIDAWGNEIYYRLFPEKEMYDFIVFSKGPDKIKGTEDDILVIHRIDKAEGEARGDGTGNANTHNTINRNRQMTLDELKALSASSEDSSDSEVNLSLEQLKGAIKSKNPGSESTEKELSIEDFKDFAEKN